MSKQQPTSFLNLVSDWQLDIRDVYIAYSLDDLIILQMLRCVPKLPTAIKFLYDDVDEFFASRFY